MIISPANHVNSTHIEFCNHDISIILIQKGDYKDMCIQKATQKYMGCPPGLPIYFCMAFSPNISSYSPFLDVYIMLISCLQNWFSNQVAEKFPWGRLASLRNSLVTAIVIHNVAPFLQLITFIYWINTNRLSYTCLWVQLKSTASSRMAGNRYILVILVYEQCKAWWPYRVIVCGPNRCDVTRPTSP